MIAWPWWPRSTFSKEVQTLSTFWSSLHHFEEKKNYRIGDTIISIIFKTLFLNIFQNLDLLNIFVVKPTYRFCTFKGPNQQTLAFYFSNFEKIDEKYDIRLKFNFFTAKIKTKNMEDDRNIDYVVPCLYWSFLLSRREVSVTPTTQCLKSGVPFSGARR